MTQGRSSAPVTAPLWKRSADHLYETATGRELPVKEPLAECSGQASAYGSPIRSG